MRNKLLVHQSCRTKPELLLKLAERLERVPWDIVTRNGRVILFPDLYVIGQGVTLRKALLVPDSDEKKYIVRTKGRVEIYSWGSIDDQDRDIFSILEINGNETSTRFTGNDSYVRLSIRGCVGRGSAYEPVLEVPSRKLKLETDVKIMVGFKKGG